MTKTKIVNLIAVVGIFGFGFVSPALADTNARVSGNGFGSDNNIRINQDNNVNIRQTNDTNIRNDVNVNNNTGHNSANWNTGGDVAIRTGDAVGNVSINNAAGMNVARVLGCNGCDNNVNASIHGNGAFSDNNIRVSGDSSTRINQVNNTNIDNNVNVRNNTGFNNASGNTGSWWNRDGDVRINTGDAKANVSIKNEAGVNVAEVSGRGGGDNNIKIEGNGAYSDNNVRIGDDSRANVRQHNNTDFDNNVNVRNNTGYNTAGGSDWYNRDYDKHNYDKNDHNGYDQYDKDRYAKFPAYHDGDRKSYDDSYGFKSMIIMTIDM